MKKNGAHNIISTLWKIDDKASYLFVDLFYKNLFNKKSLNETLKDTKLDFISKYKEYNNPHFWAGFVLYGFKKFIFCFLALITFHTKALSQYPLDNYDCPPEKIFNMDNFNEYELGIINRY